MIDIGSLDDSALHLAQVLMWFVALGSLTTLATTVALLGSEDTRKRWTGLATLALTVAMVASLPNWAEAAALRREQHTAAVQAAAQVVHHQVNQLRPITSVRPARTSRWNGDRLIALAQGRAVAVEVSTPDAVGSTSWWLRFDPDSARWSLDERG